MPSPPKFPKPNANDRLLEGRDRRRAHRASVKFRLRGVYLRCDELAVGEIRALNISETGIGLEVKGIQRLPHPEQKLQAKLLVGKIATPVTVRFVHANTEIAGFEFVEPAKIFQSALGAIFEPELVGTSLRPVRPQRASHLRFSDGRHTAIEITPPTSPGGEPRPFSTPPADFGRVTIWILGGKIETKAGGAIGHEVAGRIEPLGDSLRQILLRIIKNAAVIPTPLREQLEKHFMTQSSEQGHG
jgi:hypothetical protein